MPLGIFEVKKIEKTNSQSKAGVLWIPAFVIASALLLVLAHPNPLFADGLWFLGFFVLVPLFVLFRQGYSPLALVGAGLGWAILSTAGNMYWLYSYHAGALVVVIIVNSIVYGITFPIFSHISKRFPKVSVWILPALWAGIEYARTLGFLGNPYGALAYVFAFIPALSTLTRVGGFALVTACASLPASIFAAGWSLKPHLHYKNKTSLYNSALALLVFLGVSILVWFIDVDTKSKSRPFKISLIQQNVDPWDDEDGVYRQNFLTLTRLSRQALLDKPDLLVWSESAFVPAIDYHLQTRSEPAKTELIMDLFKFLEEIKVPLVFGQNYGVHKGYDSYGNPLRIDYNASYFYDKGKTDYYGKMRLVPFSEYFPYDTVFPWFTKVLRKKQQDFWEPGLVAKVFDVSGIRFSTPICFEDSFGYISRLFALQGAQILVNLTNDTWSYSLPAMRQHLAMAVFRTLETGLPMVRSTNGGSTVFINTKGQITSRLEEFTEGILSDTVQVPEKHATTLYMYWGDWFGLLSLIMVPLFFISSILLAQTRKKGIIDGGQYSINVDIKTENEQNSRKRKL